MPTLRYFPKVIPKLSEHLHKGQCGRIAIVGGCAEYTGAPYFAAMSSLRMGADLAYVFCDKDAALAIKSYSPDLIVLPYLSSDDPISDAAIDKIGVWLPRMDCVVVGPGAGRQEHMVAVLRQVVSRAISLNIPIVIDADGLHAMDDFELLRGYKRAILTPNKVEFGRLCKLFNMPEAKSDSQIELMEISRLLGNVTILRKGSSDMITNGSKVLVNNNIGSLRRCGGQGDILSGAIATCVAWISRYNSKICDIGQLKEHEYEDAILEACYFAGAVTRAAASEHKPQWGMLASDILREIPLAFEKEAERIYIDK